MSVTILEGLRNAEINLIANGRHPFAFEIGKNQLHNAIGLLEKGYSINDEVEPLFEEYGKLEDIPAKEQGAAS